MSGPGSRSRFAPAGAILLAPARTQQEGKKKQIVSLTTHAVACCVRSETSLTPVVALLQRVVQSFHQLLPALQKFRVGDALTCPSLQHFVDSQTLFATEFPVRDVCIVNDLSDHLDLAVPNSEDFMECFKRAVVAS